MLDIIIGVGLVLAWAAVGNIVWVLVARRKFDPACWLICPIMLMYPRWWYE